MLQAGVARTHSLTHSKKIEKNNLLLSILMLFTRAIAILAHFAR
jgi:hypothetical protein